MNTTGDRCWIRFSGDLGSMGSLVIADKEKRFVALSRDERLIQDMGTDTIAYFEAERDMGQWKIGKRTTNEEW